MDKDVARKNRFMAWELGMPGSAAMSVGRVSLKMDLSILESSPDTKPPVKRTTVNAFLYQTSAMQLAATTAHFVLTRFIIHKLIIRAVKMAFGGVAADSTLFAVTKTYATSVALREVVAAGGFFD